MEISKKIYDLADRTFNFALAVRKFVRLCKKDFVCVDDLRQVVRSSGSIGANYIEASESLGTKDFSLRIKISRKEAKETVYWLKLINESLDENGRKEGYNLITEATELMKIFGAIITKSK